MKTPLLLLIGCTMAFAVGNLAHSQAPAAPQTPLQQLQIIKAKNKQLLDRQAVTLKQLDELQVESQQLKFLGKRT